jgi:peptide/nickel transport system substrate-binding protein
MGLRRGSRGGSAGVLPKAALAATILAAGCGHGAGRALAKPIVVGLYAAPLSFDPHLENDFVTQGFLTNAFGGLTTLDANLRVEPALAVSWDTPGPTTWRFRLRSGVRFQDGRALEAADVVWSLERARHHPRSGVSHYLADVQEVRTPGPGVVEIRTQASSSLLLNRLAFVAILPAGSPDEIREPIGTGPYRLDPAGFPDHLHLRRSDVYWGRRPAEAEVEMRVVRDPALMRAMVERGEVDLALGLSPEEADRMRGAPCCRLVAQPGVVVEMLRFRVDLPPFDDVRVRRAVHLALDRTAFVQRTLRGFGVPASQLAGPGTVGFSPALAVPARDVPTARRLLGAAGHAGGLPVTLEFREDRNAHEIQRQLAEAGIDVALWPLPWGEALERVRTGQARFYYGAMVADTGDAGDILDSALHTPDPAAGLGADNHFGYSNPEVDRLLLEARTAPTLLDRRNVLQQVMERVMEELPMVPLVIPDDLYVVRRGVAWAPRLDGRVLAADLGREP